jgi:hypothetical protein
MLILSTAFKGKWHSRLRFHRDVTLYLLLSSISFSVAANQAEAASNILSDVQKNYANGNYSAALAELATLKQTPIVYYYSGLCYQGSNQLRLAKRDFEAVLWKSKDPKLRYNSRLALAYLNRYSGTRTYKGQGNNFFKPVSRDVPGNVNSVQSNPSYNPMDSNRNINPYFNPTYNPMTNNRSDNPYFNPTYDPMDRNRSYNPYFRP